MYNIYVEEKRKKEMDDKENKVKLYEKYRNKFKSKGI